ncbi:MAG: endonuclease [Flavobacterium sp.]|nr:endonuclease [Flavobacterium sp.]
MKKLYTLILVFLVSLGFSQEYLKNNSVAIPPAPGYYDNATGSGYQLKTQLYNIIKNHIDRGYSGLYTTYITSDKDLYFENNGTVLDIYTENPTGTDIFEYTYGGSFPDGTPYQDNGTGGTAEGQHYNREHLVPQSVFSSATPMYSDAHFIIPADKYVNGQRGDLPFGKVNVASNTYSNGTKKGNNLNSGYSAGYSGQVFEPIDEFKGDIARMLFYFATRYEDLVATWNYPMFNNTSNQVFTSNAINILLTWSNNDPVSQKEIDRNLAVYNRQNNRNPFVDHPEYALSIWGSLLNNTSYDRLETVTIYPNPSTESVININSEIQIDEIELISVNGQIVQDIKNPEFTSNQFSLKSVNPGFYFLRLTSNNQATTKKVIVN